MGTIGNMGVSLQGKLVVAISSRALFDFEEENRVFEQTDDRAYMNLQLERLDAPAKPGVALGLSNWAQRSLTVWQTGAPNWYFLAVAKGYVSHKHSG